MLDAQPPGPLPTEGFVQFLREHCDVTKWDFVDVDGCDMAPEKIEKRIQYHYNGTEAFPLRRGGRKRKVRVKTQKGTWTLDGVRWRTGSVEEFVVVCLDDQSPLPIHQTIPQLRKLIEEYQPPLPWWRCRIFRAHQAA